MSGPLWPAQNGAFTMPEPSRARLLVTLRAEVEATRTKHHGPLPCSCSPCREHRDCACGARWATCDAARLVGIAARLLGVVEAAEPTIRETGHVMPCLGCSCGASDRFKDLRLEFYRRWRALAALEGPDAR